MRVIVDPDDPDYDPDNHILFLKALRHELVRKLWEPHEARDRGYPDWMRRRMLGDCTRAYAERVQELVHVQRLIDEIRAGNLWYVAPATGTTAPG